MSTVDEAVKLIGAAGGGAVLLAVVNNAFGWLTKRTKGAASESEVMVNGTDFQRTLNVQAGAFIAALQADRAELEKVVIRLRDEVEAGKADFNEQFARMRLSEERCLSDNDALRQMVEAMARQLARAGIGLPENWKPTSLPDLIAFGADAASWSTTEPDPK